MSFRISPHKSDCVVVVDSREQRPWSLNPLPTEPGTLTTGDYALRDFPNEVAIERKELSDFVACCGHGRDRFQRELERLKGYRSHAVIIEASWHELAAGEWRSKLKPQTVLRSLSSWMSAGSLILPAGDRAMAERIARSMLWFAYKHRVEPVRRIIKQDLTRRVRLGHNK